MAKNSLKYDSLLTNYNELLNSKLHSIEEEIKHYTEQLQLFGKIERKEVALEEIAPVLKKYNLDNETTAGFFALIKSINNKKIANVQINKFLEYVISILKDLKKEYTKNVENLKSSKKSIKEYKKADLSGEEIKKLITKLENDNTFSDQEKVTIIKYYAYLSTSKKYQRVEEVKTTNKKEELPKATPVEAPEIKIEEVPEIKPEEMPEIKIEEVPEIKPEEMPEIKIEEVPEIESEKEEILPKDKKEFKKMYGQDIEYADHILGKRESTGFDKFYDSLIVKSDKGLDESDKELLGKCKKLADNLKKAYINVEYEKNEINKCLKEKNIEKAMIHYKRIKKYFEEYQQKFDDFKGTYLDFVEVFGYITNDKENPKIEVDNRTNDDAIIVDTKNDEDTSAVTDDHKKGPRKTATSIERIPETLKEKVTDDTAKEEKNSTSQLKNRYKADLSLIDSVLTNYELLNEKEKSTNLIGILETLKYFKEAGIPDNITLNEIEYIESTLDFFREIAKSLEIENKLFLESDDNENLNNKAEGRRQ